MTPIALPLWAMALWALFVAPTDLAGWGVGFGVAACAALFSFSLGRLNPVRSSSAGPAYSIASAGKIAGALLGRMPRQVALLTTAQIDSGFVRVRRPESVPGQATLAASLSLVAGVQTVQTDADGLLVHVLQDGPDSYDLIASLDPLGDDLGEGGAS